MDDLRLAIGDRPASPESSINEEIMILETPEGPKKVLEEEEYLDRMTKIIRRDYFPNVAFGDHDDSTPTNSRDKFNTPGTQMSSTSSVRSRLEATSLSLNEYFDRYTSEDNAYFERLQRRELKRHQRKYPWFYKDSKAHNALVKNQLMLPSTEKEPKSDDQSKEKKMVDWPYNPKNSLFYPSKDTSFRPQATINYKSSRYIHDPDFKRPFPPVGYSSNIYDQPASPALLSNTRIGVDGKLANRSLDSTPVINGFSFVPEPESPIMSKSGLLNAAETSGDDAQPTNINTNNRGKYFTISQSPRDELAYKIYEKRVGKLIRTPKLSKHGQQFASPGSSVRSSNTPTTSGYRRGLMDLDFSPERVRTPLSKTRLLKK